MLICSSSVQMHFENPLLSVVPHGTNQPVFDRHKPCLQRLHKMPTAFRKSPTTWTPVGLDSFADSGLVGVFESQRRTFDYSCLLSRDLERPLVAQVLWRHEHGLDKDIRTLLFDTEARIKAR